MALTTNHEPPTTNQLLATWLARLETRHPLGIDLGLERVGAVFARLGSPRPAPLCISVGGTNGKGSTVAFLSAVLSAAGLRVGTYTSPPLLSYNERVNIDGVDATDEQLVAAFETVEAALGEESLSYFEFGTLAAFVLLARSQVDVAVLEVGLGGRLDVVNLIDADAAILTSVDLDHQEYLGNTREKIGFDKAHLFRPGRPAIVADPDAPHTVFDVAAAIGADVLRVGVDLRYARRSGHRWRCMLPDGSYLNLPDPQLVAPCQHRNATAAIAALWALRERWPWSVEAIARGIGAARIRGRLERLAVAVETWVDVAHNPEAARTLAEWLSEQTPARTVAVFAALADKDLAGIVAPLRNSFAAWVLVDLRAVSPRARAPLGFADDLAALLPPKVAIHSADSMKAALEMAAAAAGGAGRVVVFGSFFTVAAALQGSTVATAILPL